MFDVIFGVFLQLLVIGLKAFLAFSRHRLNLYDSKRLLESQNIALKAHGTLLLPWPTPR